ECILLLPLHAADVFQERPCARGAGVQTERCRQEQRDDDGQGPEARGRGPGGKARRQRAGARMTEFAQTAVWNGISENLTFSHLLPLCVIHRLSVPWPLAPRKS